MPTIEEQLTQMVQNVQDPLKPKPQPNQPSAPGSSETPPELEQRLDELERRAKEGSILQRLLQDPDFAALTAAKNQGKKVKIVLEDSTKSTPPTPPQPEVDVNEMSQAQLFDHLQKSVAGLVERVVEQKLDPVGSQLKSISDKIYGEELRQVNTQIEQMQKTHPDFEALKPEMVKIAQANPALSIPELYILAKARSGIKPSRDRSLETEQPTNVATRERPSRPAETHESTPSGFRRGDIRQAVDQAFEHLNFNPNLNE